MCGICGVVTARGDVQKVALDAMTDSLVHRGPDGRGIWMDEDRQCGLGHRRLSIIGLGENGSQPMTSHCGKKVLVFNGEIYNYVEIRKELEARGVSFKGASDTEVLLCALVEYGFEGALEKVDGMFAFALWDVIEKRIIIARDRFGEKPLFWSFQNGVLYFASELKALRAYPGYRAELNHDAAGYFLHLGYVPDTLCIYKHTYKLSPGGCVAFSLNDAEPQISQYWSQDAAFLQSNRGGRQSSDEESIEAFDQLLGNTLSKRMRSDVPIGAFLSGGIDSSLIAAVMQKMSGKPIHTYTIASEFEEYNEAKDAAKIAKHIGSDHNEFTVSEKEALEVIPHLSTYYDEPFGDASQIPTHIICKLARKCVTVVLSGDAGDELFGGYNRYVWLPRLWSRLGVMPGCIRKMASALMTTPSVGAWDGLFRFADKLKPGISPRLPGQKMHKMGYAIDAESMEGLYNNVTTMWPRKAFPYSHGHDPDVRKWVDVDFPQGFSDSEKLMHYDRITYLPNDILQKVDRASMAVSLEVRVPYLSNEIASFASRLSLENKIRNGSTKWIMRRLLGRYVPEHLWDRPKSGFGVPIDRWLRGALREWAEELLKPESLESNGFNSKLVQQYWLSHLEGREALQQPLWNVLMFQLWHKQWG